MTIQYPDKIDKPVQEMLPDAYRGILELDVRLCTGCLLCEKTCPIQCISINVEKTEVGRSITKFDIDISKCMYCGLCQESCSFNALRHSNEFEATQSDIRNLNLHFVREPVPVAKHKPGEAPARLPPGSILKNVLPGFGRRAGAAKNPGAAPKAEEPLQPEAEPRAGPATRTAATPAEAPDKPAAPETAASTDSDKPEETP
jgi:formate hydrogenlyase subunit 6/NADH:ubiquinone oxidoreductase subunit I